MLIKLSTVFFIVEVGQSVNITHFLLQPFNPIAKLDKILTRSILFFRLFLFFFSLVITTEAEGRRELTQHGVLPCLPRGEGTGNDDGGPYTACYDVEDHSVPDH